MRNIRALLVGVMIITCIPRMLTAGNAPGGVPRTLNRGVDPIVLTPARLTDFAGAPIDKMGLLVWRAGTFAPIPFQVDEKDEGGHWVFPFGTKANPDDGDNKFGGDDELVFMARDVGGQAPKSVVITGVAKTTEIRIDDPNDGSGYAYLALYTTNPPHSTVDYVNYDPKTKHVHAEYYEMGFHPKFPIGIGYLATLPAGGGDGINVVDRMKVRVSAVTMFGINFNRNEEDFSSVDVAYIDGPVRVIRRTSNRMVLFLFIPTPSAIIDNIYYREFFLFPTEINVPFNVGTVIRQASVRVTVDLNDKARNHVFWNSNNAGTGVIMDGQMSDAEKNLDCKPFSWMAHESNGGKNHSGWMNRLIIEKEVGPLHPELYYMDDVNVTDPPDEFPGHYGEIGFILNDIPNLKSGAYRLVSILYCIPDYKPGMEKTYLDILDAPLIATATPWPSE